MNSLLLALVSLFAVASSVQGEKVKWSRNAQWSSGPDNDPWSSDVRMQITKEGAQTAACSNEALTVLKVEVGEWLRVELVNLFGEDSFALGEVTGVEDEDTISLIASVDCLKCNKVKDKKSIAYILMFFVQHKIDGWIEENYAGVLDGCMGEDTTVLNLVVGGEKAVSIF
jgi:hypothetical protein